MKVIVITVPEEFETAVVTVTYKGSGGRSILDTKSTRGKDTGWALDFREDRIED